MCTPGENNTSSESEKRVLGGPPHGQSTMICVLPGGDGGRRVGCAEDTPAFSTLSVALTPVLVILVPSGWSSGCWLTTGRSPTFLY